MAVLNTSRLVRFANFAPVARSLRSPRGVGLPHFSRLTSHRGQPQGLPLHPSKTAAEPQTSSFRAQSRNPCSPALQLGCCDYAQHDGMCRATLPPSPTPFPVFPHPSFLTPHSSPLTPHPSLLTPHPSPLTPHPSPLTPHPSLLPPPSSPLTPHPSPLPPHSSLLTPHSSLLTPHPSLLPPHPSPLTPPSSLLPPHSSPLTPHSSPPRSPQRSHYLHGLFYPLYCVDGQALYGFFGGVGFGYHGHAEA